MHLDIPTHGANGVTYLEAYAISDVITDGLILAESFSHIRFSEAEVFLPAMMVTTGVLGVRDCNCHWVIDWP